MRGKHTIDLTWSGISTTLADIYRDSVLIQTANNGAYTDNIDAKGGATYVYKVCEQGSRPPAHRPLTLYFNRSRYFSFMMSFLSEPDLLIYY